MNPVAFTLPALSPADQTTEDLRDILNSLEQVRLEGHPKIDVTKAKGIRHALYVATEYRREVNLLQVSPNKFVWEGTDLSIPRRFHDLFDRAREAQNLQRLNNA